MNAPTGPVEFVLMTLQNSVIGFSRKRLRQYRKYLRGERSDGALDHTPACLGGRRRASYSGRSAISLTSAMTSLCSRRRCLRRTSFCCRGTDSGQNKHRSVSEQGLCRLRALVPPACCSGKHSGSRMLSWPETASPGSGFTK